MAGRANHHLSWGVALLAGIVIACSSTALFAAGDAGVAQPVAAEPFPIASDVRVAGDSKQTRFVLDLDRKIDLRAFTLGNPDRVVVDIPQVTFKLPDNVGQNGRGLIKAFRYGLVMPGGSRLVFDLSGPAKIEKAYVLDAANGQPPRLIVELAATDRTAFTKSLAKETTAEPPPGNPPATVTADAEPNAERVDTRPVVVIDPGHGGIDNGTQAASGETEKAIVLAFGLALRDRIAESGKYRVVLTRDDDTFIPLGDRVKIARAQNAALFVSIHADALPRREGDAQGATIYTLSDKASDAEAERLADLENKADAIGGVNLTEEPTEVADILIDLAQRETRTFSSRFAHTLMGEMKSTVRMHKHPLKSAGFKVLKAPDVPSALIELGYVSNKDDLKLLTSESWRSRSVVAVAQAIDTFLAKRIVSVGSNKN
ncbi:MAG: N-acetylmuramoyl-L-alanine amidase [Rhizobiales bacterium]|nr:N-acetylmuramoyl-L-alanine amidase [Hyphomicrobiales bacterium]